MQQLSSSVQHAIDQSPQQLARAIAAELTRQRITEETPLNASQIQEILEDIWLALADTFACSRTEMYELSGVSTETTETPQQRDCVSKMNTTVTQALCNAGLLELHSKDRDPAVTEKAKDILKLCIEHRSKLESLVRVLQAKEAEATTIAPTDEPTTLACADEITPETDGDSWVVLGEPTSSVLQ